MSTPGYFLRLTSQGGSATTNVGVDDRVTLAFVNVNKSAASAVVNIWAGQNSTSGTQVASIDASSSTGRAFQYDILCHGGIWANMQGGNAECTITVQ